MAAKKSKKKKCAHGTKRVPAKTVCLSKKAATAKKAAKAAKARKPAAGMKDQLAHVRNCWSDAKKVGLPKKEHRKYAASCIRQRLR